MIEILCATYNGAHHLQEQISSIQDQTINNWHVNFYDDGSTDHTLEMLESVVAEDPRFSLFRNAKNLGFCNNFLKNLHRLKPADAYAFSDQDDIWYADKLERASNWLKSIDISVPAVYFARTEIVDSRLNYVGLSPEFKIKPSFRNAVVQSIGGGNTMMFNRAALNLVVRTLPNVSLISHDWWFYLVVSGCGGIVKYDATPVLKYRQHEGNVIGANSTASGQILRLWMAFEGQWKRWNSAHEEAISHLEANLTAENRQIFCAFKQARHGKWPFQRLAALKKAQIVRQSELQTKSLPVLALLNRL